MRLKRFILNHQIKDIEGSEMIWNVIMTLMLMTSVCYVFVANLILNQLNHGCTRQAANPQYIAKNILNREFTADAPNEKWLTDVTEFHYYIGIEKHKVYLSAILDLYDRRIVSYVIKLPVGSTHWQKKLFIFLIVYLTGSGSIHHFPISHSSAFQ